MNRTLSSNLNRNGFTLLELLITIAVIAVLSVVLIIVMNPAETLQKSRDVQRISDLNTMKTALGLFVTTTSSPQLDGTSGTAQDKCLGGSGSKTIWYSAQNLSYGTTSASGFTVSASSTSASSSMNDGTGWIPVNMAQLTGGSPISQMPLDPTNTMANGSSTAAVYTNAALAYRYACRKTPLTFEIAARLESATYGPAGADDRSAKDGGNAAYLYEVGTDLTILPATDNY